MTPEIKKAITHCIQHGVAFAAYRLPGRSVCFMADDFSGKNTGNKFTIKPWEYSGDITINSVFDEYQVTEAVVRAFSYPSIQRATDLNEYLTGVHQVIDTLKDNGGKTVISRIVNIETDLTAESIPAHAEALFDRFTDALGFLYYHPACGLWLGATPEILLEADHAGHFSTMALAGTKKDNSPWDNKNLTEHAMVVDYISDKLQNLDANFDKESQSELAYGNIRHLCTRFRISGPVRNAIEIANALNPTPAVCGTPPDAAKKMITATEKHERRCYAGYIAVSDPEGFHAYVNLRCAEIFLTDHKASLYAGGGITAQSIPEDELIETQSKTASLINLLQR